MSDGQRRMVLRNVVHQLPLLAVLVLLWMLLWGSFSWLNLLTGVVIAVGVTRVFFLPAVALSGRLNIVALVWFIVVFFVQLVRASAQVSWQALRPRGIDTNAVLEVPLASRSDFVMTITAIETSLVPGSIIVEVDRERAVLFIHVLGASGERDIAVVRRRVLETERRIIKALGSPQDLERLAEREREGVA